MFAIDGRQVKLRIPLPKRNDPKITRLPGSSWRERTKVAAEKVWEQSCRERWRVVVLLTKAKLEAVELGLSSV